MAYSILISKNEKAFLLASIFCMSFSIITFEITLIRMFSIMFNYHYTFLTLSLSLFGLGFGGALIQKINLRDVFEKNFGILSNISMTYSLIITLFTAVILNISHLGFIVIGCIMFFPLLTHIVMEMDLSREF